MAEHVDATDRSSAYEEALRDQAVHLSRLRVERGNPSLRTIEARARRLFAQEQASLPIATQSAALGAKYVSVDKVILLVRTLLSWDEYGQECAPPDRRSPVLEPWRARWVAVASARPARRQTRAVRQEAVSGPPRTSPRGTSPSRFALAYAPLVHTGPVVSAAFSPDGRLIATGSADNTVRLWDSASGVAVGNALTGHTEGVASVVFSPDGRLLATASADRTVRLWDTVSGVPVGEPLTGHTDEVWSVAFSPDGRLLASASADETVRLWDTTTRTPAGDALTGHGDPVWSTAFSPDGSLLATASRDKTVRLWNPATGAPVGRPLIGHTDDVESVAFSPDGQMLATVGSDGTVRLWSSITGTAVLAPLTGHTGPVFSVGFSPDGRLLATASRDRTVRLWDPSTGAPVGEPLTGHTDQVWSVAFSPDGSLFATASHDNTVRVHRSGQPRTRVPVAASTSALRAVEHALSAGHPIPLPAIRGSHEVPVHSVAFSPDGRLLATAGSDGTVHLWDPVTRLPVGNPLTGHTDTVRAVVFSPDGHLVVTASDDESVRMWTADTRLPIGRRLVDPDGDHGSYLSVAVSPDGRLLATDPTLSVWPRRGPPRGVPLAVSHSWASWPAVARRRPSGETATER